MERGEPKLTIVAIPCEQDPVHRYSSEKVPHMTIMVMAMPDQETLSRILAFVSHVLSTSLCKFWMDVKHRGVLGPNEADVLFLKGYDQEQLDEFRKYLLTNPDIRKAYDAVEQYAKWVPHITMGYPATPAKPDEREYPGFYSVGFDRIAVWTSEYSGPDFQLDDNYSLDGETRMSDDTENYMALGVEALAHYGVKGMHWGIRKDRVRLGRRRGPREESDDFRNAHDAHAKAKAKGIHSLSNAEIRSITERQNVERQYANWRRDRHLINLGHGHIKTAMAFAGTAGAVYTFYNSPFGQASVRFGKKHLSRIITYAPLALKLAK